MTGVVVYRSRDLRVIGAWREFTAAVDAYVARTAEILASAVTGEYQVLRGAQDWCRGRFAGLAVPPGQEPPPGWRTDGGVALPDPRRAAGRWAAAALAEVRHPGSPWPALIGMPGHVLTRAGLAGCSVQLREGGAALYVTWPGAVWAHGGPAGLAPEISFSVWERVPPREYHAAVRAAGVTAALACRAAGPVAAPGTRTAPGRTATPRPGGPACSPVPGGAAGAAVLRCPGCGEAEDAWCCASCGQPQHPGCGYGLDHERPVPGEAEAERWSCRECGVITATAVPVPPATPIRLIPPAARPAGEADPGAVREGGG